MIHYDELGKNDGATLICIPGLLGGPNDFSGIMPALIEQFHVFALDPDRERRRTATVNMTQHEMEEELYNVNADMVAETIQSVGKKEAYLVGVSLGSKVIYDFAIKYPDMFSGGVSMDVGPGDLENSALFRFIDDVVIGLDLTIPFADMKKILQEKIIDRSLRTMIQTQLFYPNGKPPAVWKTGIMNFGEMLKLTLRRKQISDQYGALHAVDDRLAAEHRFIHVLTADTISAIGAECVPRLKEYKSLKVTRIPGSSHFMHITHKDAVAEAVVAMPNYRRDKITGPSQK